MSLMKLLGTPQGQQLLSQMTGKLNLSEEQLAQAATQLLPAIQKGLSEKVKTDPATLENVLQQEASTLAQAADTKQEHPDNIAQSGNALLGEIFGSKEVSREVAARAAQSTGIDLGALKAMLPMLASVAGGALLSQSNNQQKASGLAGLVGGLLGSKKAQSSLNLSAMAGFLDQDNDGSIADDLLGLASKFMKK